MTRIDAVAAPALFTLIGVVFLLLGASSLDASALGLWWLATIVWIAPADRRSRAKLSEVSPGDAKLRVAHGAVAVVVIVYLAFHFSNHMFAWIGPEAHMAVMKLFRSIYRSSWGEPILLLAFLFMMLSGGRMACRLTARRADGFRTLQIVSGVYLIFAVISHLNAVLYGARALRHRHRLGVRHGGADRHAQRRVEYPARAVLLPRSRIRHRASVLRNARG